MQRDIRSWFESNQKELFLRGLWFLGEEPNTQPPEEFASSKLRVLIARLSGYHDVATGITHSYLHQLARQVTGVFADLAFLPPPRDETRMRTDGIPLWTGTTTKRPPGDFDLIAISNSVVQELLNLPALLHYSGLPLTRAERAAKGSPLLILGGSNSYATSILHGPTAASFDPKNSAGLVDGVIIGDGEEAFPEMLRLMRDHRSLPREKLLKLFREKVPGFYDPAFQQPHGEPIKAARTHFPAGSRSFHQGPLFYDEDSAGASHLLISAGCPYFCSFCKESWEQKPYRERPFNSLLPDALALKVSLGLSEIALMSFNANTWSKLAALMKELEPHFHRVSLKSQRFDAIVQSPSLLEHQLDAGKRTFTCAMEGISDRLRTFLQKNLSEDILLKAFSALFQRNIRQMKIFVIVTGQEEDADFHEFEGLLVRLNQLLSKLKGKPILTFSLAALFRPPLTPLQFCPPRLDEHLLAEKFSRIARSIVKAGFESRISAGPEDALVSEFLAYADRRHTPILVEASLNKSFRYRGSIDPAVFSFWKNALKERGLDHLFFQRSGSDTTIFPWDDIDTGISKAFLWKNYQSLESGREMSSCIAQPLGSGVCQNCGSCNTSEQRQTLTRLVPQKIAQKEALKKEKPPIRIRLVGQISSRLASVGNQFLCAAFARLIMLGYPSWVSPLRKFEHTIDRLSTSGIFIGDLLLREMPALPTLKDIEKMNTFGNGLAILSLSVAPKPLVDEYPRLICRFHKPGGDAKKIDEILQRYKLKHQKQWQNDLLTWELQSGHAKKVGFSRIELPKDAAFLDVLMIHPVEPHFLDKLGGAADREFLLPVKET